MYYFEKKYFIVAILQGRKSTFFATRYDLLKFSAQPSYYILNAVNEYLGTFYTYSRKYLFFGEINLLQAPVRDSPPIVGRILT